MVRATRLDSYEILYSGSKVLYEAVQVLVVPGLHDPVARLMTAFDIIIVFQAKISLNPNVIQICVRFRFLRLNLADLVACVKEVLYGAKSKKIP